MRILTTELAHHKIAYGSLLIGIFLLGSAYLFVWPDIMLQRVLAISIGLLYGIWGTLTHLKSNHITKQIILEYFGVGVLASLILLMLTL